MKWILLAVFLCFPVLAQARSPLPNPNLTPGAVNQSVNQFDISGTICVRGWTRTVRPPVGYTEPLKKRQIAEYGYTDSRPWRYEEDHLIPLSLGGSPTDPRNLWPEPHLGPYQWGSYAKDRLEARMVRLVCANRLPLNTARSMMAQDWVGAYQRLIGPKPDNHRPHSSKSHSWRPGRWRQ